MKAILTLLLLGASALEAGAQTIATFRFHRVGAIEVELFDDKRVTVSNFLKYASSGRVENQILHRWVPDFVIQGGGYRVDTSNPQQYELRPVDIFGTITNETHAGTFRSNVAGTIAMARVGNDTNSASSQWFINLKDNGAPPEQGGQNLDAASGGYTVFGKVISNTNLLNVFVPPPPANGIYIDQFLIPSIPLTPTPVLTTNDLTWNDLIYVDLSFRRDVGLQVAWLANGDREVSWNSVSGVTNALEYSSDPSSQTWQTLTNLVPTRGRITVADDSNGAGRVYRVKLVY